MGFVTAQNPNSQSWYEQWRLLVGFYFLSQNLTERLSNGQYTWKREMFPLKGMGHAHCGFRKCVVDCRAWVILLVLISGNYSPASYVGVESVVGFLNY